MEWAVDPPAKVKSGDSFNVEYTLNVPERFFDWAILPDSAYAVEYGPVLDPSHG